MNKLILTAFFALTINALSAQLAPGSVSPDFTATDINGNTWRLYDILNQGKTVVLDISATWCNPCWNYHTSGALEELYAQHGPTGTGEFMVFMVEGDENTTLEDLNGTGTNTQGNWVENTPYPIIDSRAIAEAFEINYFPTVYKICPNRIVTEIGQIPTNEIFNTLSSCTFASGTNNASILKYTGFEGDFCEQKTFAPAFYLQNLGTTPLTSASVALKYNGLIAQTISWTGHLNTYENELITFNTSTFSQNTDLLISATNINGGIDDHPGDNAYFTAVNIAPDVNTNLFGLELKLDQNPNACYWEITNSSGMVLRYGGNRQVKYPNESNSGKYTSAEGIVNVNFPLANNDCYEFNIYDGLGDGLCCQDGQGYFKLKNQAGNVVAEGGQFLGSDTRPFGIHNSPGAPDNAMLLTLAPTVPDFCDSYTFSPAVDVRNIGSNPITKLQLQFLSGANVLETYDWTGNIAPLGSKTVTMNPVTLTQTTNMNVVISGVNDLADTDDFGNKLGRGVKRNVAGKKNWIVDIQTDFEGYELYWEITNSLGAVVASGGNTAVGPNGGGLKLAHSNDPGAYPNNTHLQVNVNIPSDDCYQLHVVDDAGNGMFNNSFGFAAPYLRVRNAQQGLYTGTNGAYTNDFRSNIDLESPAGTTESTVFQTIMIAPNPADSRITTSLDMPVYGNVSVRMFNTQGQIVKTMVTPAMAPGKQLISLDVSDLTNGLYELQIAGEGILGVGKVVVQR
ncbi:MAG: T9SS type A sorting domain-containing protein [Bacteroidota bacterium]